MRFIFLLTFLIVLYARHSDAQTFSAEYLKWMLADSKTVSPSGSTSDSLMFALTGKHIDEQPAAANNETKERRIEKIKRIFALKHLDPDKQSHFIIAEEQYMHFTSDSSETVHGIVYAAGKFFTYSINTTNDSYLLTSELVEKKEPMDPITPRSIIWYLTMQDKSDILSDLAMSEVKLSDDHASYDWQYEVIDYNAYSKNKIRVCYLHENVAKVYHKH